MGTGSVEVKRAALLRAWEQARYEELWVQFRPRPRNDVAGQVEEAVLAANAVVDDAGSGDIVFAEGVSQSPDGPVAYVSRTGAEDGVITWLEACAEALRQAGLTGQVTAAAQAPFPEWLASGRNPPQLTAFVSYRTADPGLLEGDNFQRAWHVDDQLTARITKAGVGWAQFDGADVYLRSSIHTIRTSQLDGAALLATAGASAAGQEQHTCGSTPSASPRSHSARWGVSATKRGTNGRPGRSGCTHSSTR